MVVVLISGVILKRSSFLFLFTMTSIIGIIMMMMMRIKESGR